MATGIDRDLMIRCELAEAEGFYSLMSSIGDEVKKALGIKTGRIGGAPIWSCDAIEWPLFNRTIGLGLVQTVAEEAIAEVGRFFDGRRHAIEASPSAHSLDTRDLEMLGYSLATRRPKFVRVSEPRAAPEGVAVMAATPEDARTFARVMVDSFGLPEAAVDWAASVVETPHQGRVTTIASIDGEPAGTGFLIVSDGIGWLGGGCCLPRFRGRGVQRALIEARAALAREIGAQWLTTETNADAPETPGYSFRNMLRSGFEHAFDRAQYAKLNAS